MSANDIINPTSAANAPWNAPWPANELENLLACPVCSSRERALLYGGLVDNVFFCAPGKWTCWRCSDCGSAYLDPRPSLASIHLAYGTYYTHRAAPPKANYASLSPLRKLRRRLVNGYTQWRFSSREAPATRIGVAAVWAVWPLKIRLDQEYRHMPRLPEGGGALLDLGCGEGSFLELARACGWNVVGTDSDPKAVANCLNQGFNVLQGGIELFDGQERLFDVITLSHVLEHLHNPVYALKACHRLLKPGGQLWLETPNIDSLGHRQYGQNWRGLEPPRHLVLFNMRSLTMALCAAGFGQIQTRTRPNPLVWISRASEALKQGQPLGSEKPLSNGQRWPILKNVLLRGIARSRREFLTVTGLKDAT